MNWKHSLFKPKWQHKDAAIRRGAVTTEQHPELINSLVDIAGGDEDSRVRRAAIRRLRKLENILPLSAKETDAATRELLEARIYHLATSHSEQRAPLELRKQVANSTDDRNLIEQLASHAPEAELRHAALARVERQGLLGDCAIGDDDAKNRRFAASRISQQTTLKRVIGALRKHDKALYTELRARLHQQLLQQSDPEAVQSEALNICVLLEKQAIDSDQQTSAEIPALYSAWEQIAPRVTTEMADRYQRIFERLSAPAPVRTVSAETPSVDEKTVAPPSPEVVLSEDDASPEANEILTQAGNAIRLYQAEHASQPSAAQLKKLSRQLENVWQSIKSPHPDDLLCQSEATAILQELESKLEQQHWQLDQALTDADQLLEQLEQELEEGELQKALSSRSKLQQKGKKLNRSGSHKGAWQQINKKLATHQTRLRELRDWHHWSNNKIRKRLIAEMEVLPAADLHPDALLDRIKSLQAEWKSLGVSEQIPGDKHFAATPWMWRKFKAAGNAAFDTAREFLDKRSEVQSRHAESLAKFCVELKQLANSAPPDWPTLGKALNRGRKKLHELKNIPVNQRQKLARKLKAALDTANKAMQGHYQEVEKAKMKLIRSASQLVHLPERSEAITQAKELQSQWQKAGSLWRSREQTLWDQFREHLNPLFTQLKEQQETERAVIEEKLTEQKSLCATLQDLLKSQEDLREHAGRVQGLQDSWKDINRPDRKLQESFQRLLKDYHQKVGSIEQQAHSTALKRWWAKSELLHQLATADSVTSKLLTQIEKKWPADSSDEPVEQSMDKALEGFKTDKTQDTDNDDLETLARALCIRLEFISGLPSPAEDRDQRMQYQVDRLAAFMSGELTRRPAIEEARDEEILWLGMYSLPEPWFSKFGDRIKLTLSTLSEPN